MQACFREIFVPICSLCLRPAAGTALSRRRLGAAASRYSLHRLSFVIGRVPFAPMNKTVIEVQVRAVLPTSGGCAVFLGNNDKVFIIYVDQTVGSAITMFMREISKERPLTHDLIGHLMTALGA